MKEKIRFYSIDFFKILFYHFLAGSISLNSLFLHLMNLFKK